MRRREPSPPAEPMPPHVEEYRFEDWNELPEVPTAEWLTRYLCTVGTKGSADEEWAFWRHLVAVRRWAQARREHLRRPR